MNTLLSNTLTEPRNTLINLAALTLALNPALKTPEQALASTCEALTQHSDDTYQPVIEYCRTLSTDERTSILQDIKGRTTWAFTKIVLYLGSQNTNTLPPSTASASQIQPTTP